MRILLLGGTRFVGRHIAHTALAAGHEVVFANRGVTGPDVFAGHPHVRFERSDDASALAGVAADVVIDTSGYTPDSVRASARAVASRIRTYVFISSIDAYDLHHPTPIDETSPTKTLGPADTTAIATPELYGAHKARCEHVLVESLGTSRVLNIRAGLLIGPHDHTDRFSYWPLRVRSGGDILVPDSPRMAVQFIDARDLAYFIMHALAHGISGTFNVTGMPDALTFGDVLAASEHIAPRIERRYVWAPSSFLEAREVEPWNEMPLWMPLAQYRALARVANGKAVACGLRIRSLEDSIRDIFAEFDCRRNAVTHAGPTAEREAALITSWRREERVRAAYAAFNARDVDGALATMTDDVDWPNGWEGGYVRGHAEIRAYWKRQWAAVDSYAEPLAISHGSDGAVAVRVHQYGRDAAGTSLFDEEVRHVYTFRDDLIERMNIER